MTTRSAILGLALSAGVLLFASVARAAGPAEPPFEVVVRAERAPPDTAEVKLEAPQARRAAGSHGDPVKAAESLPGVARIPLGSNRFIVWGGSPRDTRYFVDGIEIPELFHYSALRSVLNAELVESVTFTPGAFGADYGRAIGGIVRVQTRDLPCCELHAAADVNTLDGSMWASHQLGESVRVALGARYGWLQNVVQALSSRAPSELFPIPKYFDYQAKTELLLDPGESLAVLALGSGDASTHRIHESDPGLARELEMGSGFGRVGVRYRRETKAARVDVTGWLGHDRSDYRAQFSTVPAKLEQSTWVEGARAEYRERVTPGVELVLGSEVAASQTHAHREGSLTVPPREGDPFAFGAPPGADESTDTWKTRLTNVAPFVGARFTLGPLVLEPSFRLDGYLLETSRQTPRVGQTPSIGVSQLEIRAEPRIGSTLALSRKVTLFAGAGSYSQPPSPADASAVFGTPSLTPEKAVHVMFGEALELTARLSLSLTTFYKALEDLVVRDPNPTPALAHSLVQQGSGRSYGVEFLLRLRPWRGFFGWLSYTVSRSERRASDASGIYLFDYDQPRVFSAVLSKSLGRWTFGARLRAASGFPRTPVTGAFFNQRSASYEPIFGPHNSERLPPFFQIDARVEYAIALDAERRLSLSAEVLNATNHENVEEFAYSIDYSRRAGITGLPLLAVLGARLEL